MTWRHVRHTGWLQVLEQLLDRQHMVERRPAPYKESGRGYYTVRQVDAAGVLKSVE